MMCTNLFGKIHRDTGGPVPQQKPKYGKAVFIGDSTTAGTDNGDYSFPDIFSVSGQFTSVLKIARGGSTIGNYQLNEMGAGYSCVEQIEKNASDIVGAEFVFIQYCKNDVDAIAAGAVQVGDLSDTQDNTSVIGYIKRAVNMIYNIEPTARIIFLNLTRNPNLYEMFGDSNYIENLRVWNDYILRVFLEYNIEIINIFDCINLNNTTKNTLTVTTDNGTHLNTIGYQTVYYLISNSILSRDNSSMLKYVYDVNVSSLSNPEIIEQFSFIKNLIMLGYVVRAVLPGNVYLSITDYGDDYIVFCGIVFSGETPQVVKMNIANDNKITLFNINLLTE